MAARYIIKTGKFPFVSALKRVRYATISEPTGESLFGMRVMRSTGKIDRNKIEVEPVRDLGFYVPADRTGIKRLMRVLRDAEAAELDAIDAEMKALHERKREVLKRAWEKGNVVTVKELTDLIEEE